jgi:hypothetical protein
MDSTKKTSDSTNSIELEFCNKDGINCEQLRASINENLNSVRQFIEDKQYEKAFNISMHTYKETFNLNQKPCKSCAGIFRSVVYSSVQYAYADLKSMTSGLFKQKKYIPLRDLASDILVEMDKIERDTSGDSRNVT